MPRATLPPVDHGDRARSARSVPWPRSFCDGSIERWTTWSSCIRASEQCERCVLTVDTTQLRSPTPNSQWDLRALVHHLVEENRWAVPLLAGRTIVDVGDALAGDLIGDDLREAWTSSAGDACDAVTVCDLDAPVHVSFGTITAAEYVGQLFADLVVHAWDVAVSIGADAELDPDLVAACAQWFEARADAYRGAGVVAPPVPVAEDADAERRLLAAFGRDGSPSSTLAVVTRFNEAFGRADVDAIMANMTEDCVFEDTTPPDGRRFEGQTAVRAAAWDAFFASSHDAGLDRGRDGRARSRHVPVGLPMGRRPRPRRRRLHRRATARWPRS